LGQGATGPMFATSDLSESVASSHKCVPFWLGVSDVGTPVFYRFQGAVYCSVGIQGTN